MSYAPPPNTPAQRTLYSTLVPNSSPYFRPKQVSVRKEPQLRHLLLVVPVTLRRMMNATPPAIAPPYQCTFLAAHSMVRRPRLSSLFHPRHSNPTAMNQEHARCLLYCTD
ncbi:hypothetical protein DFH08DRAFT_964343 [Mycena albidolilacea]|uniref:Uncharacterized protein n=1 Tax=Mycena albidolilacea TaxID=1033008 RepID=A0AAD6ZSK7_9AGAR|nr:hypothetical protein DFH08DRAFT_964343 [Mycena albidolilacea]